MKQIVIFAGTTEGRKLSEYLAGVGVSHTVCVATEYGEALLKENPFVRVHQGRMDQKEIERFLKDGNFVGVADATHPFAKEVTCNIKAAVANLQKAGMCVSYFRLKRENVVRWEEHVSYFETNEACAKALEDTAGNILLTIGSKEIAKYCVSDQVRQRLYVRTLPSVESLEACAGQGICGKQIIAMQGPFTVQMNEALIDQYQIAYLVTKESGITGGYLEKLEAAKKTGIQIFVIGCFAESEGYSFQELCTELETMQFGYPIRPKKQSGMMEIILAGIGMGHERCQTVEVQRAIREADLLLGAERMLKDLLSANPKAERHPFYQSGQVVPYLHEMQKNGKIEGKKAVILFSGDSGFYSGCQSLYKDLNREIDCGRLAASVRILPGISSVAYLAACIGESYQDAAIYSLHGKKLPDLADRIKSSPKTFLLTSGVEDMNWIGKQLMEAGLTACEVIVGFQLSYADQKITKKTPAECCVIEEEGLYTCLVRNPCAEELSAAYFSLQKTQGRNRGNQKRSITHGIADQMFIRDQIPMTKEEVREVSICKLHLTEHAVVYDIGSGTGSLAVEIACLSNQIQVYAIERKLEAVSLIEKNKEKFGLDNMIVKKALAPAVLTELPAASHAFIGGSGGKLKEILAELKRINPYMRIVINAVSMETICEIKEILNFYHLKEDIVQLQVSRAKKMGNYHLMQSENPVWICSFCFADTLL